MPNHIKSWLPFFAGLSLLPKIIITIIILSITVLLLLALWLPNQIGHEEKKVEISDKQQSTNTTISEEPMRILSHKSNEVPPKNNFEISMKEYFEKIHGFGDRFLERDSFHMESRGRSVNWQGFISLVQSFGKKVSVTISVSPGSGDNAFVLFEPNYREFLFSLRNGDSVNFSGVIYSGPITKPEIEGSSIGRIAFNKASSDINVNSTQAIQPQKLSAPSGFDAKYISIAPLGMVKFDYSNNNGRFILGTSPFLFETKWSKASDRSIHIYNDPSSIVGIALAHGLSDKSQILDASSFDMSSRSRTPQEGEYVILKNTNGYFAVLKILDVKDRTRSDSIDELSFEYWIQRNQTTNFRNIN